MIAKTIEIRDTALALPTPMLLDGQVSLAVYQARARQIAAEVGALTITDAASQATAIAVLATIAALKKEAEAERRRLVDPPNEWVKAVNAAFKSVVDPLLAPKTGADALLRDRMLAFDQAQRQRAAQAERERLVAVARAQAAERQRAVEEQRQQRADEEARHRAVAADLLRQRQAEAEARGEAGTAEVLEEMAQEQERGAQTAEAAAAASAHVIVEAAQEAGAQAQRVEQLAVAAVPPPKTTATALGAATTRMEWVHEVVDIAQVPRQYLMVNDAAIKAAYASPAVKARLVAGLDEQPIPGVRIFQRPTLAVRA